MIKRLKRFWLRLTDGLALNQLWKQFRADSRSTYRLYSQEIDSTRKPGMGRIRRFFHVAYQFLWAVTEKLTPARRILLLIALYLLVASPGSGVSFWGGLLMFVLLVLEITDRVVMKRDLQIAKEIQTWLLPPGPPPVPGLQIAFATRPANTVAGDYYDVFARSPSNSHEGAYLITIADVAGKSIPAAMLMATFQASLKTLAATASSLTELVGRMNNYACGNSQNGRRFTTTFIADYDPASRDMNYVNAGHNPPILQHQTGAVERLQAGGLPLGIQPHAPYDSGKVTLQSGDWLVVFTDGLTEAENKLTDEYGEERLMAVLRANQAVPPLLMLNTIMRDLDRFVGDAPQHDDITLMLLRAA